MAPHCRVGTSGWSYKHWKGVFYPEDIPQRRWFEHYAENFDTVEINATFYRLMPESTFRGWRDKAPPGFRYAVKMWRQVTHRKALRDVDTEVADFLKRAAILGDRLGPILIQLPPRLGADVERLSGFFASLSGDFEYALEFRNAGWFTEEVYEILRERRIGLCIYHHVRIDCPKVATAPLVYLRFHGESGLYKGRYTTDHLKAWAKFARECIRGGHHVAAYFNNDVDGYAVANAREFRELLEPKQRRKT